jgi:hypothetical protein
VFLVARQHPYSADRRDIAGPSLANQNTFISAPKT